MGKWGHDIDIANCHVSLMYQLGESYHTWPEHNGSVRALTLDTMKMLYSERSHFIDLIADTHLLDKDEDRYPGYRKNICKPLFMRILYGGTYDTWLREHNLFFGPRSPHIVRLEEEVSNLRRVILKSKRFAEISGRERVSQERSGKQSEASERGAFAKIAQHLECTVLLCIRDYLMQNGWKIHSLIFDGLIVEHRPDATIDFESLEAYIEKHTQFKITVAEKPLFNVDLLDDTLLNVE
jgi:hypothetical protein